jgi:hypothetical protein
MFEHMIAAHAREKNVAFFLFGTPLPILRTFFDA